MGRLIAPIGSNAAHLCVDMQNLFAPGGPWATPWLPRVLPAIQQLAAHCPVRTIFSRFIPPGSSEQAVGAWKVYYQKWACVTAERLPVEWVDLVPDLQRFVPPAVLIDRMGYSAFGGGKLREYLDEHAVDTLIVSGGETDVCVLASVLAAIDFGYRVVIVEDALCSSSDQSHDALLSLFSSRFDVQIEVGTVQQILDRWGAE